MSKIIIRETIIALLIFLAILLILSIALYQFIPSNKVIPETVEYSPSKEIQAQLNTEVEDNSEEIIMTYEVTAQDLENYQKTNEYNPGKANPFAPMSQPTPGGNGGNEGGENITGNPVTNPSNSSSNGSQGSLFENGTSK